MGVYNQTDLTGQKFGRLLAVEKLSYYGPRNRTFYKCICDCGNETIVYTTRLSKGEIKSCGCLVSDIAKERQKLLTKNNDFEKTRFGVKIFFSKGGYTLIDEEDLDKIKDYRIIKTKGYAIAISRGTNHSKRKVIKLHRLILGIYDKSIMIDHINRDPLDNRKCNLRIANSFINNQNRSLSSTNTTGYKNIVRRRNKFCICVDKNGKHYYGGSFNNIEDAFIARSNLYKKLNIEGID